MRRPLVGLAGLLILSFLVTSLGFALTLNDHPAPTSCICAVVTIKDFSFVPNQLIISSGTIVTWVNRDRVKHNLVFEKVSGPLLQTNEFWSFEFKQAGTYSYKCGPHPGMNGTIIVK